MSNPAGEYPGGYRITCNLFEGGITVGTSYDVFGNTQQTVTFSSEIKEGDYVQLLRDNSYTFDTMGVPTVEAASAGGTVIGKVVSLPRARRIPASTLTNNASQHSDGGIYLRYAIVELMGVTKVEEAIVNLHASASVVPGVVGTLQFSVNGTKTNGVATFNAVASGGTGAFSLFSIPNGGSGSRKTLVAYGTNLNVSA